MAGEGSKNKMTLECAKCGIYACRQEDREKLPPKCPIRQCTAVYSEAKEAYKEKASGDLARCAAKVEAAGFGVWPRVKEIMEFSRMMGFTRLGLAFCNGLRREALEVTKIFEENSFSVDSVMCKTGSIPKEDIGLKDADKIYPGRFEVLCNPVAQALLLNQAGTELNVMLGLCVGHDSLFFAKSVAPVTVLAVKDRVTGHNPLAAIYATHYFRDRKRLNLEPVK
jgi:uncharacterized metal-binding protein